MGDNQSIETNIASPGDVRLGMGGNQSILTNITSLNDVLLGIGDNQSLSFSLIYLTKTPTVIHFRNYSLDGLSDIFFLVILKEV